MQRRPSPSPIHLSIDGDEGFIHDPADRDNPQMVAIVDFHFNVTPRILERIFCIALKRDFSLLSPI